jgi:hypothetical protein
VPFYLAGKQFAKVGIHKVSGFHVSRFTFHDFSVSGFHVSRFTFHVSRFTISGVCVSRFTVSGKTGE